MASDTQLLSHWQTKRDSEAFAELVSRHSRMVYGAARRILGNAADAEDVTQECFLKLSGVKPCDTATSLGSWLYSVAVNRAIDRKRSRQSAANREQAYTQENPPTFRNLQEWRELESHLDQAIAELPDEMRCVIVAHYIQGKPHRAVAKDLEISRSTATRRIQKAVNTLREGLKARGIEAAAAALTAGLVHNVTEAVPDALAGKLHKIALASSVERPASAALTPKLFFGKAAITLPALALVVALGMFFVKTYQSDSSLPSASRSLETTLAVAAPPEPQPITPARIAVVPPTADPVPIAITKRSRPAAPPAFNGTIQGSVIDAFTKTPLDEFQILVKAGRFLGYNPRKHRGFQTVRSADGLFFINEIRARAATVFVRAEGYDASIRYIDGLESDTAATDMDFALHPLSSLTVYVSDTVGRPLEGIQVHLANVSDAFYSHKHEYTETDESGTARFDKVLAGRRIVTLAESKEGYKEHVVNIVPGKEQALRLVYDPLPSIHGIVYYAGNPIKNATLSFKSKESSFTATTDEAGTFAFTRGIPEHQSLSIALPLSEMSSVGTNDQTYIEVSGGPFSYRIPDLSFHENQLITIPLLSSNMQIELLIPEDLGGFDYYSISLYASLGGNLTLQSHQRALPGKPVHFGAVAPGDYSIRCMADNLEPRETLQSGFRPINLRLQANEFFDGLMTIERIPDDERLLQVEVFPR